LVLDILKPIFENEYKTVSLLRPFKISEPFPT